MSVCCFPGQTEIYLSKVESQTAQYKLSWTIKKYFNFVPRGKIQLTWSLVSTVIAATNNIFCSYFLLEFIVLMLLVFEYLLTVEIQKLWQLTLNPWTEQTLGLCDLSPTLHPHL